LAFSCRTLPTSRLTAALETLLYDQMSTDRSWQVWSNLCPAQSFWRWSEVSLESCGQRLVGFQFKYPPDSH
jgi:hypothetical protein